LGVEFVETPSATNDAAYKPRGWLFPGQPTFATYLLESGTNISYIQQLLGHTSLRTTERYTHVAKRDVLSVISPLDTM
jgi:integrase